MRLDPRRWSRLEVSDFSNRVYRSRRRRDGNGASSAFSTLGRNTGLTRTISDCRVPIESDILPLRDEGRDPGDSLRGEAMREPKGLSDYLAILRSLIEST